MKKYSYQPLAALLLFVACNGGSNGLQNSLQLKLALSAGEDLAWLEVLAWPKLVESINEPLEEEQVQPLTFSCRHEKCAELADENGGYTVSLAADSATEYFVEIKALTAKGTALDNDPIHEQGIYFFKETSSKEFCKSFWLLFSKVIPGINETLQNGVEPENINFEYFAFYGFTNKKD